MFNCPIPTSTDRYGLIFLLARSKQFKKTIRIITNADHIATVPLILDFHYYKDHDVLLDSSEEAAYLFYKGKLIEIEELSLYSSSYPIPDAWFDKNTVITSDGNLYCKVTGEKNVVYTTDIISDDDWNALLGGDNVV